jgi:hypothetical protein
MAGEVRIGTSVILGMGFTATVVDHFFAKYPRIVTHLLAAESGVTYRALEERNVDLILIGMFEPTLQEQFEAEVLYRECYVVAAGIRNPLTRRSRLTLRELLDEPWTLPPTETLTGRLVLEAFRAAGLDLPRAAVVTDSIPARNALSANGRYLTIVPESVFRFAASPASLNRCGSTCPRHAAPWVSFGWKIGRSAPALNCSCSALAKPPKWSARPNRWCKNRPANSLCRLSNSRVIRGGAFSLAAMAAVILMEERPLHAPPRRRRRWFPTPHRRSRVRAPLFDLLNQKLLLRHGRRTIQRGTPPSPPA